MTIKIKYNEDMKEISVKPENGKPFIISEQSETWNTQGINNFLIRIISANPDNEKITVSPLESELQENDVEEFKFVVQLFNEFVNEYNK